MDLVATSVYKTKDYDKFIINENKNRDVNVSNVKKIKNSIKIHGDHGVVFPIVVDDKMNIIDGQHRFTARKELGLTIYYIQDLDLDISKLGGINDSIKKWIPKDYEKVNSDKSFYKKLKSYKEQIDENGKLNSLPVKTFSMFILGINNNKFLTADEEFINDTNIKFNLIKPYISWCMSNLFDNLMKENKNTVDKSFRPLCTISKMLLKNKVNISNLEGINCISIASFIADLYSKGLIKK